jgi:hypothetical protein
VRPLRLETSKCRRTLTASGSLTEVVRLDGVRAAITIYRHLSRGFSVERI